jgi:membrane-associated phospholipid phosphatase
MMEIGSAPSSPVLAPRGGPSAAPTARRAGRSEQRVPVLAARRGGAAARFASGLGSGHPARVFAVALAGGFVLLCALSILLGLLVVHVLGTDAVLGGPDDDAIRTLYHQRTSALDTVSSIGSAVGGAPVLPIIAGLVGIVFALMRRWLIAAFAVFALTVESATYRVTTLVVHRERPNVPRLDDLPANASYPSGHTAASIAVYSGLVLLLTSSLTGNVKKALLWTLAILATTLVALSRMYRGMHHPLDVAGGIVVGIGAILILLFACRAAGAAAEARRGEERS